MRLTAGCIFKEAIFFYLKKKEDEELLILAFFILVGMLAALVFAVKGKYAEDVKQLDEREFKLKQMLPAGLFVLEIVKYKFTTAYDRRLLTAISEIKGTKQAHFYLKIHWASKLLYIYLGVLFCIFVGCVSRTDAGYFVFSASLISGIFYFADRELFEQVKKRRAAIRICFPDFANKLMLLINAGMTVSRAWEKIASDSRKDITPLQREICLTMQDIRAGRPEHSAYEEFAKRCRTPEITRFISVILQNVRKGNAELVPLLRVFTNDCWEMRKSIAKKYGEEASTKMLLPLMLMFIAILLIVGTPAVLALRGI